MKQRLDSTVENYMGGEWVYLLTVVVGESSTRDTKRLRWDIQAETLENVNHAFINIQNKKNSLYSNDIVIRK